MGDANVINLMLHGKLKMFSVTRHYGRAVILDCILWTCCRSAVNARK